MKVVILFVVFVILISCSSTQLIKHDSDSETSTNNADQRNDYKFANTIVYEEPPYVIRKAQLEYPKFALNNKIEGIVMLQVEVYADGTVGTVVVKQTVMSGQCVLGEAAVKSVKKWKFSPAKSGGKPVNCRVTIPITFSLD